MTGAPDAPDVEIRWHEAPREELIELFDRPVHLFLTVKVRPGWLEERERYGEIGLDFSDGEL